MEVPRQQGLGPTNLGGSCPIRPGPPPQPASSVPHPRGAQVGAATLERGHWGRPHGAHAPRCTQPDQVRQGLAQSWPHDWARPQEGVVASRVPCLRPRLLRAWSRRTHGLPRLLPGAPVQASQTRHLGPAKAPAVLAGLPGGMQGEQGEARGVLPVSTARGAAAGRPPARESRGRAGRAPGFPMVQRPWRRCRPTTGDPLLSTAGPAVLPARVSATYCCGNWTECGGEMLLDGDHHSQ